MKLKTFFLSEMTFLDVFDVVEYESAIISKLPFLKGGGGSESLVRRHPLCIQSETCCELLGRLSMGLPNLTGEELSK